MRIDLRRVRTCTRLSHRVELHHSSRPRDQWGPRRCSQAAIHSHYWHRCPLLLSPHCPPEAERERGCQKALSSGFAVVLKEGFKLPCSSQWISAFYCAASDWTYMCLQRVVRNLHGCVCTSITEDKTFPLIPYIPFRCAKSRMHSQCTYISRYGMYKDWTSSSGVYHNITKI